MNRNFHEIVSTRTLREVLKRSIRARTTELAAAAIHEAAKTLMDKGIIEEVRAVPERASDGEAASRRGGWPTKVLRKRKWSDTERSSAATDHLKRLRVGPDLFEG